MKKLIIALFAIFLLATYVQANDPYWDGYDDAKENQGEWSNNEKYLDGYEDAQRQIREREEREQRQQEQEEQRRREQERQNNRNWQND